jgi:hypothetical protein
VAQPNVTTNNKRIKTIKLIPLVLHLFKKLILFNDILGMSFLILTTKLVNYTVLFQVKSLSKSLLDEIHFVFLRNKNKIIESYGTIQHLDAKTTELAGIAASIAGGCR